MAKLIFPRRPDERISYDSRPSDAAKARYDRSEFAFRSVVRPCAARALRAGSVVLVSALGALSTAAGNAHGQPTLPIAAQQESYPFGIDSLVFTVTRTATIEGEIGDSVTQVQDELFPNPGLVRWNITLAAHDGDHGYGGIIADRVLSGSDPDRHPSLGEGLRSRKRVNAWGAVGNVTGEDAGTVAQVDSSGSTDRSPKPAWTKWRCIVKRVRVPVALAIFLSLPASSAAAEFSYSYLELMADVSRTENTAVAPLADDSHGQLFGIAASLEVFDSLYLKGAWSRETKDFRNEVAHTPVDLDSRQTVVALGAGYHFDAGETDQTLRRGPRDRGLRGRASDPHRRSFAVRAPDRLDGRLHHRRQWLQRRDRSASLDQRKARARRPALTHPYPRGCRSHRRTDLRLRDHVQDRCTCSSR